jgi:hypothetical protein
MMQFATLLLPFREMLASEWDEKITCISFSHVQLLSSTSHIMLTKDGIHTLTNVVIAKPTHANLFSQFHAIQKFATFDATQARKNGYRI